MDEGDSNEFKYQNVERWSRRMASVGLDIFQADTLLFPINQMNNHWVLVVACISQKKLFTMTLVWEMDTLAIVESYTST